MNKTFTITIPTENGFVGNACKATACQKYFKIDQNKIDEIYCPYCGVKQKAEATKYAENEGKEEAIKYVSDQIDSMFDNLSKSFRGNKSITIKRKPINYRKKSFSKPIIKEVDSQIECSDCNNSFQVYGIFGYCPYCKYENLKIYDTNIEIIKKEIEDANRSDRSLRHAYSDLVSAFQGFCNKKNDTGEQVNFQNLKQTKRFFKKYKSIYIYKGLTEKDKVSIKRIFMKRHVYIHPNGDEGIISKKYIKEVPEDRQLLGQKAKLSFEEFIRGTELVKKMLNNISV
jgi:Zn finger protein HypA/HybF involved in hydrogenase expression